MRPASASCSMPSAVNDFDVSQNELRVGRYCSAVAVGAEPARIERRVAMHDRHRKTRQPGTLEQIFGVAVYGR